MDVVNLFGKLGLDDTIREFVENVKSIARPLTQITGGGSNRLSVDVNSVTTVTTCSIVGNQSNIGGASAFEMQKAMSHSAFANNILPHLN